MSDEILQGSLLAFKTANEVMYYWMRDNMGICICIFSIFLDHQTS
jgi:hypothetical protein